MGYQPPLENTTPSFFAKISLKSANYPSSPFLGNCPYILVFCEPHSPKNWIFHWTPIILKLFILNPIHCINSYLKLPSLNSKLWQRKVFLFINFFVIKYFRFWFTFYIMTATRPDKGHPLFPSNPPLKTEILPSHPLWKFGRRINPPSAEKGAAHYGLSTLVPQEPFCVADTLRSQVHWSFQTDDMGFASTLIWYHKHVQYRERPTTQETID